MWNHTTLPLEQKKKKKKKKKSFKIKRQAQVVFSSDVERLVYVVYI